MPTTPSSIPIPLTTPITYGPYTGWNRCFWYYVLPQFTSNGSVAPPVYSIPQSYFAFGLTTRKILVQWATANIWGVQTINGGGISVQIDRAGIGTVAQPKLVTAFDGYMQSDVLHPGDGVIFEEGDKLLVETMCKNYTNEVNAGAWGPLHGNATLRTWAIGMEYMLSP